jgi:hypothetical protein
MLIYFFLAGSGLFGLPFDMILTGDAVLDDIRYLSLESGKSFLSFSPPLAPAEIRNFLNSIDESSLSQPAREAYYRISNRLMPKARLSLSNKIFSAFLNINLTLEGKTGFNPDISWFPHYPESVPLFSFPFRFFFSDYVQLYIEPSKVAPPEESGYTNIPSDFSSEYLPIRSFGAAGGSWWNFQIGRDRLFWGTSHTGSLTFSDSAEFFDFARISFFSPNVKYSLIINQLPIKLKEDLFLNPPFDGWENKLMLATERYFYLHRIDVSLFDKVSFSAMEGVMAGNSSIELRYLNPLIIFHSLYSWQDYVNWNPDDTERSHMNGSFFSVELNWNIIKSLAVYGQFVMNEISLRTEIDGWDEPIPNALGYIAGLHFTHSFKTWGSIFYLEFIYTDPYLYILSSPFSSFIQQNFFGYKFIGYPRDTMSVSAGAEFFNKDNLSFSGSFSWVSSGEHDKNGLKWDWQRSISAWNERTPSGTAENKFVLGLGAKWKPLPYIVLKANIAGIVSLNNKHIPGVNAEGGQASLSVSLQY